MGGYWPLEGEMDVRPLLVALSDFDFQLSLPCVERKAAPLTFRQWTSGDDLCLGAFGVREPLPDKLSVKPSLLFLPLLAFTPDGKRLGYGGGYYDRTLEALRRKGDVFACGVAYAGQEVTELPTDEHDQRLDAILAEDGFRTF